jgi:hypothetical protein
MNNELEGIWKEAVVAYHGSILTFPSVTIAGVRPEIRIQLLPNKSRYASLAGEGYAKDLLSFNSKWWLRWRVD